MVERPMKLHRESEEDKKEGCASQRLESSVKQAAKLKWNQFRHLGLPDTTQDYQNVANY